MEPDDQQSDSTFGDGSSSTGGSTTTSIKSAITKYEFEHGRRYHAYKAGRYVFPNDEKELERLDIEHHNQGLQLGALHLAPIGTPQMVLDVGTGTGVWATDMGDLYPSAVIVGTDLSPVQATWVPPNVKFEIDDFEEEWTFGSDKFDFVHMRSFIASVSDYPRLYKQAFDALKPGGWLEVNDVALPVFCDDGTFPEDSASVKWAHWFEEAMIKLGRPVPKLEQYKLWLEQVGFVDVQERILKRPTNDWPKDPRMKEIGRYTCLNYLEGVEGFTLAAFTRALGWSAEEVQVLCAQIRTEWTKRSMHGYQKGVVVYGRKPTPTLPTPSKDVFEQCEEVQSFSAVLDNLAQTCEA